MSENLPRLPSIVATSFTPLRLPLRSSCPSHAQAIAAHESPRTTKLYDLTSDEITLDEVERIAI
jgi:hypothetical protein